MDGDTAKSPGFEQRMLNSQDTTVMKYKMGSEETVNYADNIWSLDGIEEEEAETFNAR